MSGAIEPSNDRSISGSSDHPIRQEALLPGTKAIMRGTLEWTHYKKGWLVRGKTMNGTPRHFYTIDYAEAEAKWNEWIEELRVEAHKTSEF